MIANHLLNEFLESETQKLKNLGHAANAVTVVRTSELAKTAAGQLVKMPAAITPRNYEKRLIVSFLIIDIVGVVLITYQLLQSGLTLYLKIFGFALTLLLSFIPVSIFLRNQRTIELHKISAEGIFTTSKNFTWNQLIDTLILKVPKGKETRAYLVIVTTENLFLKFDLSSVTIGEEQLSLIIENYKSH